jgi:gliding motility-associated-like protein
MKKVFTIFLLLEFVSATFLNQALQAQSPASPRKTLESIFRDGKFFFNNPSLLKNSNNTLEGRKSQSMSAPCYHCTTTASVKKAIVTGGPIILYITSQNATCGYGSGNIIVQAANGTAPYSFTLDIYPPQSTGNFPVVGGGAHTIKVTDATGTTVTTTVTLTDIFPGPVVVNYVVLANPSTCAVGDGIVQLQPTGGTPPYSYSMDLVNFQTSNVFSNLWSGVYYFFVKDANGCIGINLVNVFYAGCDGTADIAGGYACGNSGYLTARDLNEFNNGPFLYSLDGINYQNTGNYYNLSVGMYNLYMKDKNNRIQIFGFNIAEDCQVRIQYIAVSAACQQNDGSMTVTATNGTPPYSYTIDGINYQSSNVFTGLAPGNYYITAMDATRVKSSLQAVVYDRCPVVEAVSSAETCAGKDGAITAAGFKGTGPYQFAIDGINFQTGNSFSGLAAGAYTITIKDALGFTGTVQVSVNNSCLAASTVTTPSTCGNSNGSVIVSVTNGVAPYQYSVDGVNFQAGSTFNNLAAGGYMVTVKDANGTTTTTNAGVTNIAGPQITATASAASCSNNDGGLDASNIGGTSPFRYSVDGVNFQSSSIFSGLDTGTKIVTVQDANGCTASLQVIVPVLSDLSLDAGNNITICEGTSSSLSASTNGDTFSWAPSYNLVNTATLKPTASPDTTTKYYLTAKKGICSKTDSATVVVNPAPVANAGLDASTCYGKSVPLQGSGGVNYLWSPDTDLDNPDIADPTVIKPVNTITYSLIVTDGNHCTALQPATVTVTVTPPAKVFAGNDTAVIINQPLQLNAVDINNSGFDTYRWSPPSGLSSPFIRDPVAVIVNDITYYVTASTAAGCEGIDSISITVFAVSDILVPNAFTPNGDGHNDIFKATPIGIREFKYLAVYDRWGRRVFYTSNPSNGWDGTVSGNRQSAGTYVWMAGGIDYKGNTVARKGTVLLIR